MGWGFLCSLRKGVDALINCRIFLTAISTTSTSFVSTIIAFTMSSPRNSAVRCVKSPNRFNQLRSKWRLPSPSMRHFRPLRCSSALPRSPRRPQPSHRERLPGQDNSPQMSLKRTLLGPRRCPICPRCRTDDIHYNVGACEANLVARVVHQVNSDSRGDGLGLTLEEMHALFSDVQSYDLVALLPVSLVFVLASSSAKRERLLFLDPLIQAVKLDTKETTKWFVSIPT